MLKVGEKVKDFTLKNKRGEDVKLSEVAKKYTVIFFYPKNNTIGCTKEACSFNELKNEYDEEEIALIGISTDSSSSHMNFSRQYSLDLILLSDADKKVSKYFNVINYETKTERAKRVTFILDSDLKVIYRYDKVKPATHGYDVLKKIKERNFKAWGVFKWDW